MPIAIDPLDPVLVSAELDRFKTGIASASAAEDELEQSRRQRHLKLSREITAREQADAELFQTRLTDLAHDLRQALEAENVAYEARKDRVQHAYHASRASLARRFQQQRDNQVGGVQTHNLSERKIQQQRLDGALADHHELETRLLAERETRHQLRDSTLRAFRSFRPLLKICEKSWDRVSPARSSSPDPIEIARAAAAAAQIHPAAKFFRFAPLSLLALIIAGGCFALTRSINPYLILSLSALLTGWLAAFFRILPIARRSAIALANARHSAHAAHQTSAATIAGIESEIAELEKNQTSDLTQTLHETDAELRSRIQQGQQELQRRLSALPDRMQELHRRRLEKIDRHYSEIRARISADAEKISQTRALARSSATHASDIVIDAALAKLAEPWQSDVTAVRDHLAQLESESRTTFPAWDAASASTWAPPAETPAAIRIGSIQIHPAALPKNPQLALKPADFKIPLSLGFPNHGSLLIETDGDSETANATLNAISTRILASLPPGRASFVFIDPVGLGKDFAGLMHLADYEETLITRRIWTQSPQIEERLAELNEHIEKVIQMFLRNEFATIADYNEQAGTIAEKYHFLVIAGFPNGFSETAARRLRSIATSGPRCGVHLLIQQDLRAPSIDPTLDEELRRNCLLIALKGGIFKLSGDPVSFDPAPADEDASVLIHRIGKASVDSNRVEVPFSQIAPETLWQLDTSEELRIPIGRSGAKKLQMLAIGKGTRQHALIAGKTGSGKSTLFHVIITNLALHCSPQQVEFYLVDFKKGVEFKCYADKKLPHARVVAIESDRQFALSVLQKVDAELKHRGELFRKASAQDLAAYNRSGSGKLPRTLLLIDEFQEFFTEDDATAQQASLLLDRIVRQGRAFGIHAILGSQTLGGAYTLARATLGQMAIRIALQCNEADAHLIMDEENPAPRLLTRPGEGIYNDQSGMFAANSPFQIVWLPERERDAILDQVSQLALAENFPASPIIFEGNAPAEIRDNAELSEILRNPPKARPAVSQAWLGAPNSIKGPTAATFKRQSGSNLLVVSQSEEHSTALLSSALLSLSAQYPPDEARFIILDPQAADDSVTSPLKTLAAQIPHPTQLGGPAEIPALFALLAADLDSRAATSGKGEPEIFLIVHDLQRFKSLRPDDEFKFSYDEDASGPSPSATLAALLGEGGPSGLHVIATIDHWNNVSRWIPRKLLAEFEMRVLFQMSATDSSNLIDSPEASTLGLHRALLHNEHLGTLETFRPYATPAL